MNNNSDGPQNESRNSPRQALKLEAIIKVTEPDGTTWKEIAAVTTVSRTGLGFTLSRPCIVGRLVTMVLPMPTELRAYDHHGELYPVMALVQNCYRSSESDEEVFHIGVALIGKEIPESFKSDPCQNFRIDGMGENGLWKVVETKQAFTARRHQRYWKQLRVTLTLLKSETKTIVKESTVTRNIAAKGASVVSELDAEIGDRIKFNCKDVDFFSLAIVRDRKVSADTGTTLHLEFIDAVFPMEAVRKEFAGRVAAAGAGTGVQTPK
jgi:hypothetical protein